MGLRVGPRGTASVFAQKKKKKKKDNMIADVCKALKVSSRLQNLFKTCDENRSSSILFDRAGK